MPLLVAGADDALDPRQVGGPQTAVRLEGGVHGAFIAGHSALQANRESVHALRGVVGNARNEAGGVGVGVKLRVFRPVLEDRIDHAHIHEQAFGGAARVGWQVID